MSATDNIARTWDGVPLWCSETERELYAIARGWHDYANAPCVKCGHPMHTHWVGSCPDPQAPSSNAQVEGESLDRWADDGGATWA
jgi:hypothetical protein